MKHIIIISIITLLITSCKKMPLLNDRCGIVISKPVKITTQGLKEIYLVVQMAGYIDTVSVGILQYDHAAIGAEYCR
jgi:hypothetical protein